MNKHLAAFGAIAGLVSAILLTTGFPSFGHTFNLVCSSHNGAHAATRALPWRGSESVEIRVPASVHFKTGTQWQATATGPEALLAHLQFNNGKLEFDQSMNLCDADLQIELTGPDVRHWTLAGSGTLALERIDQANLDVVLAGSGIVTASGKVTRTRILIAGSGNAKLDQLAVQDATVQIRGSGNVDIAPVEIVEVEIGGSGNVRLWSKPKSVQTRIRGSGNVVDAV